MIEPLKLEERQEDSGEIPLHIGQSPLEKKKEKKKIPFWEKIFRKSKLGKPNKVAVIFLRNNGRAEPMELETSNGFFRIAGKTYHENRDCFYSLGKERYPLALIPEWSLIPIGTKKWEDKDMLEKFAELQDHTLRGIRNAELVKMGDTEKGKINTKAAIGLGIAVIVGLAILQSYL